MEKQYRFSIIVPVYNVEKYLQKCVDSLLCQDGSFSEMEIILVDDGSSDQSGRMCDAYAERHECIKALHKKNGGLSSARNYGIDRAAGEYVIFVDSDDYMESCALRVLDETLEKNGRTDVIVYNGTEESPGAEKKLRSMETGSGSFPDGRSYLLEQYRNQTMNVEAWLHMYRKEFLDRNHLRFKEGILHEDVEFTPRALLSAKKVVLIPDGLYHYVVRENSISTQKDKTKNIQDLFRTLEELDRLADRQDEELKKWMKNAVLNSYLNMIYDAGMYRKNYRKMVNKQFLVGKAATGWNRCRVILCGINVWLYCHVNDFYKKVR